MVPWELLPIVIVFVGAENMFNLVDAVTKTSTTLTVKDRIAEGLARAGTSNTLKVVSYNSILGVLAVFSFGAIRQFCVFAIVVLVAHWFLAHTFFLAVLSIDIQRLGELDTIIRRLCAGLDGAEYIMNDLWELVCANDTQVVDRNSATVSHAILPELVYEISIILQLLGASGIPHFSLERTEEFLLDIAHRKNSFKEPPSGLDRRKRVLLLAQEHMAKPYRSGGPRLAKRKRPYSLTELLHLVESIEHHFPLQHFDLRLPRIVASLGNSEVCPRSFPHGRGEESGYVDHIVWGLDITTPTLMSTSNREFRQWSPFGVGNANISVPHETSWADVCASAIHPSGEYVALGYENGDVVVFETFTGALISTMAGDNNYILSLTFSSVDPLLASASSTVIKIWDLRTGEECAASPFHHPNRVSTVAFSPDGKRLASISVDDSLRVWNISNGKIIHNYDGSNAVVWSPDGKYLAHVYLGEPQPGVFCVIRDAATCEVVASRPMKHDVDCMAFSPNGKQLAVGLEKTVLVMDVESLRDLARFHLARTRLQNRMEFATDLAFSPDGQYLAALTEYGEVSVWAV
ncbi:hypothetical protein ONZ45_g16388 [Pleurotus djamor]|nr:hypothetical protein ONZ45_g16388 [Pleurotus djamor]